MAVEIDYEALITEHSRKVADQITKEAAFAGTEEDLRITAAHALRDFLQIAKPLDSNIDPKGKHEYHLAKGRPDSVYQGVFIEYKSPGLFQGRKDSPGAKAVLKQLKQRFKDFEAEERKRPERLLGVGCDGQHWFYVRHRDGKFEESLPTPIDARGTERLLRAFLSLGVTGKSYLPKYLAADFGMSGSQSVAYPAVRSFYHAITNTKSPKADLFFRQWKILFGEVCGYDVEGRNPKIEELAKSYVIDPQTADPARLLFSVHTYYALFMKILAAQVVSTFASGFGISPVLHKLRDTRSSNGLLRELEDLELRGGVFAQAFNITNFLEGDLFTWYLDCWKEMDDDSFRGATDSLDSVVRRLVARLADYQPQSLSADPTESRDLLKKLYQNLVPKKLRHDMGEHYTPDWLAEHVLNELGYDGDPDKRLLDPGCGSATFLVLVIARIRRYFEDHREELTYDEGGLLERIERNVIGFDLNPLAVMAARTNYLIAVRDLLRFRGSLAIPIYFCDSIVTPADYSRDIAKFDYLRLRTEAGTFQIPKEVISTSECLGRYANALEHCVRNTYDQDDFLKYCDAKGLPISQKYHHLKLYGQLQGLAASRRNSIWARIIKNAFAPLFIEPVDFVAGNPPWVNWENLPEEYRQSIAPLWQQYDLFRHKGYKAKLGGGKDDISVLMTYVAHDKYLKGTGSLGFLITQTVFKTKGGGEGFRTFEYESGRKTIHLRVQRVDDMSDLKPFEDAANRTAVFICRKSDRPLKYPVPYVLWRKRVGGRLEDDATLEDVLERTDRQNLAATPVDPGNLTSPWLTAPEPALRGIQKVIGKSDYKAYAGCCTWLNGVFWIRILKRLHDGNVLIENLHDVGKIKVEHVETVIEPDLVYPLLRGRDVRRWHAEPAAYIILANRTEKLAGIPESEMKHKYPKTYEYFKRFEKELRQRSGFRKYFKPTDPFYSIYNVGPYTVSLWKAIWSDMGVGVPLAAVGHHRDRFLGDILPIPGPHTMFIPLTNKRECSYCVSGFNCSPAQCLIASYGMSTGTTTHIVEHARVRRFDSDDKLHVRLVSLSQRCHAEFVQAHSQAVSALEMEIDNLAAKLWGITDDELKAIQDALEQTKRPGRRAERDTDDEAEAEE